MIFAFLNTKLVKLGIAITRKSRCRLTDGLPLSGLCTKLITNALHDAKVRMADCDSVYYLMCRAFYCFKKFLASRSSARSVSASRQTSNNFE